MGVCERVTRVEPELTYVMLLRASDIFAVGTVQDA